MPMLTKSHIICNLVFYLVIASVAYFTTEIRGITKLSVTCGKLTRSQLFIIK